MASEQQIEANRRNAGRSTGPKSLAGKRRAAQNSFKHGLAGPSGPAQSPLLEKFAGKIAGGTDDATILDYARAVAAAEIELARIRRIRVAVVESAASGTNEGSESEPIFENGLRKVLRGAPAKAEPVRSRLVDVVKLIRYENRAAAKRDAAVGKLTQARRP